MEYFLLFTITVQSIAYLVVFYLLYKKDEIDRDRSFNQTESYSTFMEGTQEKFIEQIGKTEKAHFEQVEKQSSKQLALFEKQTKSFLDAMTTFTIAMAAVPKQEEKITPGPHLLDNEKIENSIEKEEPKEYFLDEISRIPNINDMKIKLLDEEKIFGESLES